MSSSCFSISSRTLRYSDSALSYWRFCSNSAARFLSFATLDISARETPNDGGAPPPQGTGLVRLSYPHARGVTSTASHPRRPAETVAVPVGKLAHIARVEERAIRREARRDLS